MFGVVRARDRGPCCILIYCSQGFCVRKASNFNVRSIIYNKHTLQPILPSQTIRSPSFDMSIRKLPVELLHLILTQLTNIHDLQSITLTSRTLHAIASPLIQPAVREARTVARLAPVRPDTEPHPSIHISGLASAVAAAAWALDHPLAASCFSRLTINHAVSQCGGFNYTNLQDAARLLDSVKDRTGPISQHMPHLPAEFMIPQTVAEDSEHDPWTSYATAYEPLYRTSYTFTTYDLLPNLSVLELNLFGHGQVNWDPQTVYDLLRDEARLPLLSSFTVRGGFFIGMPMAWVTEQLLLPLFARPQMRKLRLICVTIHEFRCDNLEWAERRRRGTSGITWLSLEHCDLTLDTLDLLMRLPRRLAYTRFLPQWYSAGDAARKNVPLESPLLDGPVERELVRVMQKLPQLHAEWLTQLTLVTAVPLKMYPGAPDGLIPPAPSWRRRCPPPSRSHIPPRPKLDPRLISLGWLKQLPALRELTLSLSLLLHNSLTATDPSERLLVGLFPRSLEMLHITEQRGTFHPSYAQHFGLVVGTELLGLVEQEPWIQRYILKEHVVTMVDHSVQAPADGPSDVDGVSTDASISEPAGLCGLSLRPHRELGERLVEELREKGLVGLITERQKQMVVMKDRGSIEVNIGVVGREKFEEDSVRWGFDDPMELRRTAGWERPLG